jgi:hypothetical protein
MEECGIDLESLYTKADKNLADLCDRVPVHMVECGMKFPGRKVFISTRLSLIYVIGTLY